MARGYFIRVGDRTTCGGTILSGDPRHTIHGLATARNGDTVTCGKDGRVYRIAGGLANYIIHGAQAAGTLHSRSTCPCNAGLIASLPEATYWEEEGREGSAALLTVPLATITPAKVEEPVQHAQVTNKQSSFAETCNLEDNELLNGVYIWTETTDAGHVFVSVHESNNIYLYTYGRYGRKGPKSFTGDGILNFLQDEDARGYYRSELYRMRARAFRITDANPVMVRKFFENIWSNGKPAIQTAKMKEATRRRGHTIDEYDVTGSNCTTHSIEGIKFAGSKVFDNGYKSMTTQLPIEAEEDFTIPVSLQKYLVTKGSDFSSMIVVEMTDVFKAIYPNKDNLKPYQESPTGKAQHIAAVSVATGDSLSPYSGGTVGGFLGGSYDVDE